MPRVVVIIPAYNPGPFLRVALESVVTQTFTDWEAIVVDDGSPEDVSWVSSYHPRVRLIRQANAGTSAARNTAILASDAPLIALLDQDDVWRPEKLATQVEALDRHPDAVMSHTQMRFIDEVGREGGTGWGGGYTTYEEMLLGCGVCAASVVVRRSVLRRAGLFDPVYRTSQDYDLWLRATRFGPMHADPADLTLYRLHGSNQGSDFRQMWREVRSLLVRERERAVAGGCPELASGATKGLRRTRRNMALIGMQATRQQLKQGSWATALRSATWSLAFGPFIVASDIVRHAASRLRHGSGASEPSTTLR